MNMKVLFISFSLREEGNCSRILKYCSELANMKGNQCEFINMNSIKIGECGGCEYYCFSNGKCIKEDDTQYIYNKCFEVDKIIFAIPTFCGNLTSLYFKFWERSQGIFKDNDEYENKFLRKINIVIIGNLTSGGDMALHEALYGFTNREFSPEALILSSREYGTSSINGDLIENENVKIRVNQFMNKIIG